MKKMTILAIILTMLMALTACSNQEQATETTAAPTTAATVPAETIAAQALALTDYSMSATTWSSPNGATIHISAVPNYYAEGQKADFVVRLESDEVINTPCQWDGTSYTASADLNAANGYCYYLILTDAENTSVEVPVNTPAEILDEAFINLEASLESYCSVTVEESLFDDSQLTLVNGTVQIQAPVITNAGEAITCQEAALYLTFNGEELDRKALTLAQSDTQGLFECTLENVVFTIPEMEDDQKVELYLDATLSNGQILSAFAGNWFHNEEGLLPVVG